MAPRFQRYQQPEQALWNGRKDGPDALRFHEVVQCVDLQCEQIIKEHCPAYAFVGFSCDAGIARNNGRIGAAEGPLAFRKAMANLPIPSDPAVFYDVGNITCSDGDLEASQNAFAELIANLLHHGIHPLVIGGGHELAWGHYKGIAKAGFEKECSIVNFDAHLDLRPLLDKEKGSSGTSFLQIANERIPEGLGFDYTCIGLQEIGLTFPLKRKAKELKVNIISAEEIYYEGISRSMKLLNHLINQDRSIYLTICLDTFAASIAPGVSSPQALGILPWHIIPLIQRLASSKKVLSIDIAELSPPHDPNFITASLAASLMSIFLQASLNEQRF